MLALRFVALFFVFPAFAALPAVSVAEATPCSGTFLPDQRFLFALPSGDASAGTPRLSGIAIVSETIEEASQRGRTAMMVLQGGADLDNPAFERATLSHFEKRENEERMKLVTLTLGSGGSVTVEANQAVATPFGDLVRADAFRLGQSLLKANGTYGIVWGIESSPSYDPVYDITLKDRRAEERTLVVSDGVLVGLNRCGILKRDGFSW